MNVKRYKGCPNKSVNFKVRTIVVLLGWQSHGGHLSDVCVSQLIAVCLFYPETKISALFE